MKVDAQRVKIQGHLLHRITMHPDDGVPERAAAIFYHGQGDYADRYPDVLLPFTDRGIRCVVTDLPGHGYSPGRRGHCGDEVLLDAVIENTLESFDDLPYLVMGHSMGGLLAARHLVMSGQGKYKIPLMAWINAPLIQPSNGRSQLFVALVRFLSSLVPELTISTGVTPKMCRKVQPDDATPVVETPEYKTPALWHRRISLGWGAVLLKAEKLLEDSIAEMPMNSPILLTQGAVDPVCPVEFAREFYQQLPQSNKLYQEFEDGLHELFSDEGKERLTKVLVDWLDEWL